ncbi:MAG: AAA family ATPase [Myxococcota bacterium]
MLTRVLFENFKNLRQVEVELRPFTVLVGPNGGGKTSVLQGLSLATDLIQSLPYREVASDRPFHRAFAPENVVSSGRSALRIGLADEGGQSFDLHVGLDPIQPIRLSMPGVDAPLHQALALLRKTGAPSLSWSPRSALLQLDFKRLVAPSTPETASPRLGPEGDGLASVMSFLAGAHPDRKSAIEADVAAIVPWFRRARVVPHRMTRSIGEFQLEEWGHRFLVETTDGAQVHAELVSEGTVLVLGLMTLLHEPDPPQLLLLDDIDRGLHLGAQVLLVRSLRALQARRPDLQIVATTHSPFLLQEFEASEVQVLGLTPAGVRSRPLSTHPRFEQWRHTLGTGELWANLGEEWVGDAA